jgi:hypothetical protein
MRGRLTMLMPVGQKPADRDRTQVMRFFDGLKLAEPGLVPVHEWRPVAGAGTAARLSCGAPSDGRPDAAKRGRAPGYFALPRRTGQ